MNRRAFVAGVLELALVAVPLPARAEQGGKVWRIGYLTPAEIPRTTFIDALREFGYVEGQNVTLDVRAADNDLARLPELAPDLVRAHPDIIVAVSSPAIRAATQATTVIPIVMRFWGGERLVESGVRVELYAAPRLWLKG